MLKYIKQMERVGDWAEIRRQGPALLAACTGEERARIHLSISQAYEMTATTAEEYRTALHHSRLAFEHAAEGSYLGTWALHRVTAYLADMGDFAGAEKAAQAFLTHLPQHPKALPSLPYVTYALGRIRSRQHRHSEAVAYLQAAHADATGELKERAAITLARVYARAGRVTQALKTCPASVQHVSDGHLSAAMALILLHAGDYSGALKQARSALADYHNGSWPIYDAIAVGELLLTLKCASHALGLHSQAATWHLSATVALFPWGVGVLSLLHPTLGAEGGEWHNEARSSCGPAGYRRCGLRGVVG